MQEIAIDIRTQKELQAIQQQIGQLQNYVRGVLIAIARQGGLEGKFDVAPDCSRIIEGVKEETYESPPATA